MSRFVVVAGAVSGNPLIINLDHVVTVEVAEEAGVIGVYTTLDTDDLPVMVRCSLDRFIRLVDAKDLREGK